MAINVKVNLDDQEAREKLKKLQEGKYNLDVSVKGDNINKTIVEGVATNEIVKDMANVAKQQAENVIKNINRASYAKGVRKR